MLKLGLARGVFADSFQSVSRIWKISFTLFCQTVAPSTWLSDSSTNASSTDIVLRLTIEFVGT